MATTRLRDALAELLPVADSPANDQMSDIVGNKTDTLAGDSLVGLVKAADAKALAAVTAAELAVTTAVALQVEFEKYFQSAAKCYPTLGNGIAVADGGVWTLGAAVQIVPINTITSEFCIHHINVSSTSANDTYELVLYRDVACTLEVGRARTSRQAIQAQASNMPFMTPKIPANSGIWAKLASATGGNTLVISIFYHTY